MKGKALLVEYRYEIAVAQRPHGDLIHAVFGMLVDDDMFEVARLRHHWLLLLRAGS